MPVKAGLRTLLSPAQSEVLQSREHQIIRPTNPAAFGPARRLPEDLVAEVHSHMHLPSSQDRYRLGRVSRSSWRITNSEVFLDTEKQAIKWRETWSADYEGTLHPPTPATKDVPEPFFFKIKTLHISQMVALKQTNLILSCLSKIDPPSLERLFVHTWVHDKEESGALEGQLSQLSCLLYAAGLRLNFKNVERIVKIAPNLRSITIQNVFHLDVNTILNECRELLSFIITTVRYDSEPEVVNDTRLNNSQPLKLEGFAFEGQSTPQMLDNILHRLPKLRQLYLEYNCGSEVGTIFPENEDNSELEKLQYCPTNVPPELLHPTLPHMLSNLRVLCICFDWLEYFQIGLLKSLRELILMDMNSLPSDLYTKLSEEDEENIPETKQMLQSNLDKLRTIESESLSIKLVWTNPSPGSDVYEDPRSFRLHDEMRKYFQSIVETRWKLGESPIWKIIWVNRMEGDVFPLLKFDRTGNWEFDQKLLG